MYCASDTFIAFRTKNSELTMVAGLFLTLRALFLTPGYFPQPLLPEWLPRRPGRLGRWYTYGSGDDGNSRQSP